MSIGARAFAGTRVVVQGICMHKRNVVGDRVVHFRDPVCSRVHGMIDAKMHLGNRKHARFVHLQNYARRGELFLVHGQETIDLHTQQSSKVI